MIGRPTAQERTHLLLRHLAGPEQELVAVGGEVCADRVRAAEEGVHNMEVLASRGYWLTARPSARLVRDSP